MAVHELRHRQPVLPGRASLGRRLQPRPRSDPQRLSARGRPPRPRFCSRSVPAQGHDAALGVHARPFPDGPGGDADQRRHAELHHRFAGCAQAARRPHPRHPRHGVQGRVRRPARVAQLQSAQAGRVQRRAGAVHRSIPARQHVRIARAGAEGVGRDSHRRAAQGVPPGGAGRPRGRRHLGHYRTHTPLKILVTGAAGFICGYLIAELLEAGHEVVGVDNYSKYGPVRRSYDGHPRYRLVEGDAKDAELLTELAADADHIVAGAAMIGGISYFHEFAYDLLAENERICAATFDAAISGHKLGRIQRITVISSSMVFESSNVFPTPEGAQLTSPPPKSTYGFQKLATEYFAKGAHEQYGLPYTIVRPFSCVGVGERRALRDHEVMSGNVKLAMSHVVPDLCQTVLKDQDPLHILGDGGQVRHYTYGGDVARGIRLCVEHPAALNEDFNISTHTSTTVLELAELVWRKIRGAGTPFRHVSDPPFQYDVRRRVPSVEKAKRLLGFEATTPLDTILDEVIPWIERQVEAGLI